MAGDLTLRTKMVTLPARFAVRCRYTSFKCLVSLMFSLNQSYDNTSGSTSRDVQPWCLQLMNGAQYWLGDIVRSYLLFPVFITV